MERAERIRIRGKEGVAWGRTIGSPTPRSSGIGIGKVIIRGLRPSDEAAVRWISCETAFMGEPISEIFDCLDLVADLLTYYYIHFEPESCFVAEDEAKGEVVGYILGAVDTRRAGRIMASRVYPRILWRIISGRYRLGRRELAYGLRLLGSALRGEIPKPDLDRYPAHLHINVLKGYRGKGIGTRLMVRFLEYLRERGAGGVHLVTTNMHREALPFYERMGFQIQRRVRTRVWEGMGIISGRVENLLLVRSLA